MNLFEIIDLLRSCNGNNVPDYLKEFSASTVIEHKEVHVNADVFVEHVEVPHDFVYKHNFIASNDYTLPIGYTNLKIMCEPSDIKSIQLKIGGSEIDIVYPSIVQNVQAFDLLTNHVVPRYTYNDISLYFHVCPEKISTLHDIKIEYDIVVIDNPITDDSYPNGFCDDYWNDNKPIPIEKTRSIMYYFNQHNGSSGVFGNPQSVTSVRMKLNYCMPIVQILVKTDKPLNSIDLILYSSKNDTNLPNDSHYKFTKVDELTYVCEFDNYVNFSHLDMDILQVHVHEQTEVNVIAKTLNVLKMTHGVILEKLNY